MRAQMEVWGPVEARAALAVSAGNRALRTYRVKAYSRDMLAGEWKLQPHGPVFGEDGRFYDGHHTASAIIECGEHIALWVTRGMDPSAAANLDGGLPRSAGDAMRMAGMGDYSDAMLSTALALYGWPTAATTGGSRALTRVELQSIIERHSEALTFACTNTRSHGVGWSRASRGLVARAFPHVSSSRLQSFCEIVTRGQAAEGSIGDGAAVTYSRFLSRTSRNAGGDVEVERYQRGQYALRAFVEKSSTNKLFRVTEDLFPL